MDELARDTTRAMTEDDARVGSVISRVLGKLKRHGTDYEIGGK
jgi:hypothetical protein